MPTRTTLKTNAVSKEGTEENPSQMLFEEVPLSDAGGQEEAPSDREDAGSDEDQGFDTDGSEASAYSLVTGTEGTVNPANYIELPSRACRHLYHLTVKKGGRSKKIPVACGRLQCRLRGHEASLSRQAVGYYVRQPKGETVHGRLDYPCLSVEEYQQAVDRSKRDTARDIAQRRSGLHPSDPEDPPEDLSSEADGERADGRTNVAFDLSATTTHAEPSRRPPPPALSVEVLDLTTNLVARRAVERSPSAEAHRLAGFPRLSAAVDRVPGRAPKAAGTSWFGLIDLDGDKLITCDPTDAEKCLRDKFRLMDLFKTKKEAKAWRDPTGPPVETVLSSDEEEDLEADPLASPPASRASSSRKKTPLSSNRDHKAAARNPSLSGGSGINGYGLTFKSKRTLCWDLPQLRLLEKKGWKVAAIFEDEMEATEWLLQEPSSPPAKKGSSRRSSKRRDDPASSDEWSAVSGSNDASLSPDGSSAESSSDGSDDESDGDSSGGTHNKKKARARKHRRRQKSGKATKKRSRRHARRTKTTNRLTVYGPDPSLGDPDRIFGVPF